MGNAGGKSPRAFTHKGEQRKGLLQGVFSTVANAFKRGQGLAGSICGLTGLPVHVLRHHLQQLGKLGTQAAQGHGAAFATQAQQQRLEHPGTGSVHCLNACAIGSCLCLNPDRDRFQLFCNWADAARSPAPR